jgi:hypothetical protein
VFVAMLLVDAHVHIYDCFDVQVFLNSALANFEAEAARHARAGAFEAAMLLTETARDHWFERLTSYARSASGCRNPGLAGWTFHPTRETCSLWARSESGSGFFVIAGSQIVTAEDLEVLALMTTRQFKDGLPLRQVMQTVKQSGALAAIPWGFGKWTGRRGRIVEEILRQAQPLGLFLGDNSGRPLFFPRPAQFKLADSRGIRTLPGSDPLPFASESWRPGSFGFLLEGTVTPEEPARGIRRMLMDPSTRLLPYGTLENPYRFWRNQLVIQLKKQLRKRNWIQ